MISAIIITLNEEKNIKRAVLSLFDRRITQIIIVDSHSTDNTVEIIRSINDSRISLVSYTDPPFTPARGRFEGTKRIDKNNKYILFLDGDMEYCGDFTDVAIKLLDEDPRLAGIMGQRNDIYYKNGNIVRQEDNYYNLKKLEVGGCLFLKLPDYFQTPGFKKELVCDEEGFLYSYYKMQGKHFTRINRRMFVHHTEAKMSKEQIATRLKNGRLTGLGITLFYCFSHPYLLFDFVRRRRKEILTGVLIVLLFYPKNIITVSVLLILFCYLLIIFKFKIRLFLNFTVYILFMFIGFFQALYGKLFKNVA
jgi:glycosyltransferase involved in cell wall biosynthesis